MMEMLHDELCSLLGHTALLLVIVDEGGRVLVAAGRDAAAALGAEAEVVGRALDELAGARPSFVSLVRRAIAGEAVVEEIELSDHTLLVQAAPLHDASGATRGAIATGTQAPRRRQSDEAFMRLFQASPIPISISTLQGGIFSHCNDAFIRTFGYPREEVVGHGSVELGMWSPEERARAIGKLKEKGFLAGHESTVRTKDGDVRDTIFNMERIEWEGQPRLVGFFFDITERKRAEEDIRRLYEQQKQLDELKSQLMANVSHELRTPLTLILGLSSRLLGSEALSPSSRSDIEGVRRNAQVLLNQVNALLDVARLDSGHVEAHYVAADLAHLVRLVASPFEVLASERGVTYVVETPKTLPAEVDADKIERIAMNLLSNAFKYTPHGGTIRCTLSVSSEGRARLVVADSGPGIPAEHRERVFERFFQVAGGSTRRHGGTGLGLAIVREFAELQHGRAWAAEAPEGGALVTVDLPLCAPTGTHVEAAHSPGARAGAELAVAELAKPPSRAEQPRSRESALPVALIVEDNPEMRQFVADSLAEGHRVETAEDGEEGFAKALALHPDVVVTDMMMPRMSGAELVAAMRARPELDGIPILLLTARADDGLRARLLRDGAQDYLTKPFSVEELRARVGNLVAVKRARDALRTELGEQTENAQRSQIEKEAADRANKAKSEFLSSMSHELRTPLHGILGFAQILERSPTLSPSDQDSVQVIRKSGQHLLTLINDVLDLAKIEAGKMELHPREFDFASMLRTVESLSRVRAEQKKLRLVHASRGPRLDAVVADEKRVMQVLLNLLGNAIKFTDEGSVTFRASVLEGSSGDSIDVRFEIEDTGPGIAEAELAHIFEPFVQVGATRARSEGTGLGLSISQRIVDEMGGKLEVRSELGRGSIFAVTLPFKRARHEKNHTLTAWGSIEGYRGERRTILVVDDNADNRAVARGMLAPLGFEVLLAADGETALGLAAERLPALILMDLAMPGLDGCETTRRLRVMPGIGRPVIIACSADLSRERREESARAGCDDWLPKPVDASALLELVGRRLDLEWSYKTNHVPAGDVMDAAGKTRLPPPELFAALLDVVGRGRLQDFQEHLGRIGRDDAGLGPWIAEVRALADGFELKKLQAKLEADAKAAQEAADSRV